MQVSFVVAVWDKETLYPILSPRNKHFSSIQWKNTTPENINNIRLKGINQREADNAMAESIR